MIAYTRDPSPKSAVRHCSQSEISFSSSCRRTQKGPFADQDQGGKEGLRFHWKEPNSDELKVNRFTRALFGLTSSPFLLAGVNLDSWKDRFPELVQELRDGLYVDDLMTCGVTVKETEEKKAIATALFEDATFSIHKWHSNGIQLEAAGESSPDYEVTYAKQQLGGSEPLGGKFLGLPWNREQDNISVILNVEDCTTKGVVLSQLAKDYDPFGFVSPTTLVTKLLYSDICDTKIYHDIGCKTT